MPKADDQERRTTAAARGREVRRRLLAAAVTLIPEVGWDAVSTRLLAERAGVAPGLVHYHFASLPDLLRRASIGAVREALTATSTLLTGAATPEGGVDAALASLDAHTGTDAASLLFAETYLAASRDPALRAELAGLLGEFRAAVAGWLAAHGHDRPQRTAAVLAAAVDGVILHRALDPDLTAEAVTPVLRRLLAPAPTEGSA